MLTKRKKLLLSAGAALLVIWVGAAFAQGSREQPGAGANSTQVLSDILSELRQLRRAVQDDRGKAYRGLMIVERVRNQQEHVDRLGRQLEDLRVDISTTAATLPQMQERVKDFESQVEGEQDQVRKSQLESELKAFKAMVEQQAVRQQQQQQREIELSAQLEGERAKLGELNAKLQALEEE